MSSVAGSPEIERLMQLPRAYEITHSWGRLIVSAAAHEAYGLVPLQEPSAEQVTAKHELDIAILSPAEHSVTLSPADRTSAPKVHSHGFMPVPHITAQRGIQIVCSFEQDRQGMLEANLNKLAELEDVSPQYLAAHCVTKEGNIPIQEHLDERLNTALAHAIRPGIIQAAYAGYQQVKHPLRRRMPFTNVVSMFKAEKVADDVHGIFCSDCFNQRFSKALES